MVFLGNLTFVEGTKYHVGFQHNMPFDTVNGIKSANGTLMTEAELEQIGVLVDSMPEPVIPTGQMVSAVYVDKSTKEVTYDYANVPLSDKENIANLQASLIEAQNAINSILGV